METINDRRVYKESSTLDSVFLERTVLIDFYIPNPAVIAPNTSLLLINDGQDLERLELENMLQDLYVQDKIHPLVCVGIHAGIDRKLEYGTAGIPDYRNRGRKASEYTKFIFQELMPSVDARFPFGWKDKSFAGFSLGALSAMDIVWSHARDFLRMGAFSGSFWWRTKDITAEEYADDTDRIMHRLVREGNYYPWLKFFFECGTQDEQADRNHNGIIDSIDDTLDLIKELVAKGYELTNDISYYQIPEGKHDVATWAAAMPQFLEWGWAK